MRSVIFIVLLTLSIFASSKLYFLPSEADEAKSKIINLINSSTSSIEISMYNFSYKKFSKALLKAQKRGLKIKVYFDGDKVKHNDKIYKKLKEKGILCKILDRKNHLKIALFDKKKLLFGSINWTKKSFENNYEILYYTNEKQDIKKAISLFSYLEKR